MASTPLRADYWVGYMSIDSPRHPDEWEATICGQRAYFRTKEEAMAYCQDHFDRIVESLLIEAIPETTEPVTENS